MRNIYLLINITRGKELSPFEFILRKIVAHGASEPMRMLDLIWRVDSWRPQGKVGAESRSVVKASWLCVECVVSRHTCRAD